MRTDDGVAIASQQTTRDLNGRAEVPAGLKARARRARCARWSKPTGAWRI